MEDCIFSALVHKWPCSFCSDHTETSFHLFEDGSIRLSVSGCGGYQGRGLEKQGEVIDRDKAVSELKERIDELRTEQQDLLYNLEEAEEMLEHLLQ